MKKKIAKYTICFLLISIITQSYVLIKSKKEIHRMPIFLPVSLEFEQRQKNKAWLINPQYEDSFSKGHIEGITADDLVRGMLSIERNKKLTLAKEQAIQIFPILQKMAKKRAQLLELRNLRHHLNEASTDAGIHIVQVLTAAQFNYIISNRDKTALLLEEKPYWDYLINSLKNKNREQ